MTLPLITAPPGTPAFLAEGLAIEEDSPFAQVPFTTGHSRARRVWTVSERVVPVRWFLEPALLIAVDGWYEVDLLAGERHFAAQIKAQGPGVLWWRARWMDFQTEMLNLGRGIVSGRLLLTGDGSVEGPVTGPLAMEVRAPLRSVASGIALPKRLAMEVGVPLISVN